VDLFREVLFGLAIGGGIYAILEIRETWKFSRDLQPKPVSGLESAVGTSATVSKEFSDAGAGVRVGRVEFGGENWRAEYIGNQPKAPAVGQSVHISDVDSGRLTVKVVERVRP